MTSWGDEVYAAMDSGVWDPFLPVDVDLLLQVRLILVVNEFHNWLPAKPWQGCIEGMVREEWGRKQEMDR